MRDTPLMIDVRRLVQVGKDWLESPDNLSIRVIWSPINQCWLVMWKGQLLRIFLTKDEAYEYVGETFPD